MAISFPAGLTDELRSDLKQRSIHLRREHRELGRTSLIFEIRALSVDDRSRPVAV